MKELLETKNIKTSKEEKPKLHCEKCGKSDCAMYQNNYNGKNYCFEHSEYKLLFQE